MRWNKVTAREAIFLCAEATFCFLAIALAGCKNFYAGLAIKIAA
jgi:hypothetical protein